ncbi:MAG: MATE family efflux transporter, partial [Prolixibacteraceae bacterium]|nr:MATE family efflux transporter [Prolixibacteraceae bacterium]
ANVVNVAGNYIFIYGKFGAPELGLVGAGVGTFIARVFMLIAFGVVIASIGSFRRCFQIALRQVVKIKEILKMLKIGIPIAFQLIVEMSAFSIGAIMMGWLGDVSLAAHQVAMGLSSATYMISLGISTACTIRVSHQMGMGDFAAMRKAAYAAAHMAVVFMSLMGVLFIIFRHQLPLFFTKDEQVIHVASQLLIVAALFQVFDGLQVVMLGNLRGMADVKVPMAIAFLAYLGLGIPASWFLAFRTAAGPTGIWYGYLLGLFFAGIFFFVRFRINLKKLDAIFK